MGLAVKPNMTALLRKIAFTAFAVAMALAPLGVGLLIGYLLSRFSPS